MTPLPAQRAVELEPKPPFNFPLALRYVATSPSAVLERVSSDGVYQRALRLAGQDVLLAVRSLGTTESPRLLVQVRGDSDIADNVLEAAITTVRRTFTLDADATEFLALAERDPIFGTLITCLHGIRPILIPDPFEALIWAVIGQQINVAFARKLKLALVELCGRRLQLPENGEYYPLSPEPPVIAALDSEQLRARQYSRQKAAYVLELARAVAARELDLSLIATMPHEEAIAAITQFRGAGRWTAEYVLMRGLGVRDSLPAADLGLRAVIGRWYGLERHASESEVRELAKQWAGWRGWAAFYWWFAIQNKWFSPEECKSRPLPGSIPT